MAAFTIGKIFIIVVVLFISMSICLTFLGEWGTLSEYNTFNSTLTHGQGNFISTIYNPLNGNITKGLNYTNNLIRTSSYGFAFGFIISGFGNIVTSLVQLPSLLNQFLMVLLDGMVGATASSTALAWNSLISTSISELILTFLLLTSASAIMKYPLF